MDVGILLLGAAVGTVVSRRFPSNDDTRLLTISIGLSMGLFCSSMLDVLPSETSLYFKGIVLDHLYHVVLYGMNIHCCIVIPTAVCLSIAPISVTPTTTMMVDEEEQKKRSFRRNQYWLRYVYRPVFSTVHALQRKARSCCPFFLPAASNSSSSSALPMTTTAPSSPNRRSIIPFISPQRVMIGMLISSTATYWAISRIRHWIVLYDASTNTETICQIATSSLCAIGILLSAILNGLGSVTLPYTCLLGFFLHPVSDTAIRYAEQELDNVRSRLENPRKIVHRHHSSDNVVIEPDDRKAETEFLSALMTDMVADMDEMNYIQRCSRQRGLVRRIAGIVCLILLLVRLSTALNHVWSGATTTMSTPFLPLLFTTDESVAQLMSVAITAVLSVSQVRTFINVASAVQRRVLKRCCYSATTLCRTNTSKPHATWALSIGWLLDCYTLACVVLTKQMMGDTEYYLKFRTNRYMFDLTFAGSALVSTAVLAIVLGILRANSQRYMMTSATTASPRGGLVEV